MQCVEGVLNIAVEKIRNELLPKYLMLMGNAHNHNYSCGVAIDAPEAVVPIRILKNLALHRILRKLLVEALMRKTSTRKVLPEVGEENIIVFRRSRI